MFTDPSPPANRPSSTPVPYASPAGGAAGPAAATWTRHLYAVRRARIPILLLTLLGAAGGVAAAHFTRLTYRADATVWVEVASPLEAARGPIRTGELLRSYGWIELLRSYSVLDHTVRELGLYVSATEPDDEQALASFAVAERYRPGVYRLSTDSTRRSYRLTSDRGQEIETGRLGGLIGGSIGLAWRPAPELLPTGRPVEFRVTNVRDRATELGEQLETQMIENSNFLRISLVGTDPEETARTLEFVTERYVDVAAELKRAKLDELTGVLANQLRYAEENLKSAESALEEFRIHTITLPSESATPIAPGVQVTRDPVLSSFFDLRIQREQIRSDREALDEILGQVRSGVLTVEALSAVPSVQQSLILRSAIEESAQRRAELRSLLERYTDAHERVRRAGSDLSTLDGVTIPSLVLQVREQLLAQERLYEDRIGMASRELEQIPPRAIEEARLVRRVEIANTLHSTLRQRYEEARLAAASSIPDIRILDPAIPPGSPISDPRPLLILLAIFGSLGVGVAAAVAKEAFDARVRYPEQITMQFGLPVLGAVPHVGAGNENAAHVLEAFREIRLGLVHAYGSAGPVVVTVTSPESGDGKSFVAANLAMAFALRGDRTLLIDADVRRGKVHHLLGGQRAPGLTTLLEGRALPPDVVQPTDYENLFLIGSGQRLKAGPELLASSQLPALLASLRAQFDVIIVDSPPLGAGADAYVLATLTRDVMVVLRTGVSDGNFAEAKLEVMDRLPVRVLGAVLNDFVPGKLYRYYSYLPGYGAEGEAGETLAIGSEGTERGTALTVHGS